jgi:hypothetical protein
MAANRVSVNPRVKFPNRHIGHKNQSRTMKATTMTTLSTHHEHDSCDTNF